MGTRIQTALVLSLLFAACQSPQEKPAGDQPPPRTFEVPKSLEREHDELHSQLEELTYAGGRTGEAARAVQADLESHFAKENMYALPPLSLLVPLSQDQFDCSMTEVLAITDKLEAELPAMLSEHKVIVEGLMKLNDAATIENKRAGVQFVEKLMAHAQAEEEITYPAGLVVGRQVKSRAEDCPN
jgi:hypothetical protein